MNVAKSDYLEYLQKLGEVSGVEVKNFASLIEALKIRLDYFDKNNCSISDHSLDYVMYVPASEEEVEAIFAKRLSGEMLSIPEKRKFETAFMVALEKIIKGISYNNAVRFFNFNL